MKRVKFGKSYRTKRRHIHENVAVAMKNVENWLNFNENSQLNANNDSDTSHESDVHSRETDNENNSFHTFDRCKPASVADNLVSYHGNEAFCIANHRYSDDNLNVNNVNLSEHDTSTGSVGEATISDVVDGGLSDTSSLSSWYSHDSLHTLSKSDNSLEQDSSLTYSNTISNKKTDFPKRMGCSEQYSSHRSEKPS